MRSKHLLLLACSLLFTLASFSQVIRFSTNLPVTPDSTSDASITELRFYISNIQFFLKKKMVYSDEKQHHLIDLTASNQFLLEYSIPAYYDSISFLLGVDKKTAESGVFGGDLDPRHGMYWTWHSGYIHLRLEGYSKQCASRNHKFQYHIGGPESTIPMGFRVIQGQPMHIQIDLKKWIHQQPFDESEIMIPGERANAFANYFSHLFILNP